MCCGEDAAVKMSTKARNTTVELLNTCLARRQAGRQDGTGCIREGSLHCTREDNLTMPAVTPVPPPRTRRLNPLICEAGDSECRRVGSQCLDEAKQFFLVWRHLGARRVLVLSIAVRIPALCRRGAWVSTLRKSNPKLSRIRSTSNTHEPPEFCAVSSILACLA